MRVALIDAEHTNRAAFRDFLKVLSLVASDSLIVFHDSNILIDALWNVQTYLKVSEIKHCGFFLRDHVFVLALGALDERAIERFQSLSVDLERFYEFSKNEIRNMIAKACPPPLPRLDESSRSKRLRSLIYPSMQSAYRSNFPKRMPSFPERKPSCKHMELLQKSMKRPKPLAKMLVKAIGARIPQQLDRLERARTQLAAIGKWKLQLRGAFTSPGAGKELVRNPSFCLPTREIVYAAVVASF